MTSPEIFTVGHSNMSFGGLVSLLKLHQIFGLVDIRTVPFSRRHPQFNASALSISLPAEQISYAHQKPLGGLRKPLPDSPNRGLLNLHFRGYADHMGSPPFAAALAVLVEHGRKERLAVMCAEGRYTECHRFILADALLVAGFAVLHIQPGGELDSHKLNPLVKIIEGNLQYPGQPDRMEGGVQLTLFGPGEPDQ